LLAAAPPIRHLNKHRGRRKRSIADIIKSILDIVALLNDMCHARVWSFATAIALASSAHAADAPVDRGFVGSAGTDADGYPLATADKRVPLRLLRARKFDELDAWLNDLQDQFESDWRKEYWPSR
jgi:hypothetical protein